MKRKLKNHIIKGLILAVSMSLFTATYAQTSWLFGGNSIGTSDFLGSTNSVKLTFITNSLPRITINSDGNVGIGTTMTTGFLLSVDGKLRAREVRINMDTWADFVFTDTYKPMNLTELELFIKKNKHLPGIPSQMEVMTSGISINEITVSLLQKIEELTLYTIEMNKKMGEFQLLIEKQQAELELLKEATHVIKP